jgi:hypothetical protein
VKKLAHAHGYRIALIVSLSLALLMALGVAQTARALEVDRDGVIEADEVIDDDVYMEAGHVVVDGTVNGVLVVSAGDAKINGTVNGDLILFVSQAEVEGDVAGNLFFGGQTLELNGTVEGSVFAGGSSLTLGPSAVVERNLLFGGFSLQAAAGSIVGRDIHVGGYQAILSGQIDQDVVAGLAALEIEGNVGGDVTATVDPPDEGSTFIFQFLRWPGIPDEIAPAGLQVGSGAEIAGTLTYRSPVEQAEGIQSSAIGEVVYEYVPPEEKPAPTFRDWFVGQLQKFLTLVVLGALVAWRAPALLGRTADQARAKPFPSILWGLLALCVIFFGLIALAIAAAILGVLFAVVTLGELLSTVVFGGTSAFVLLVTLLALIVSYGTKLIVSYLVGTLILGRLAPKVAARPIWPLLLGIVLYVIFTSIPCLGDVIGFIVALIGLGAIWLLIRQERSTPEEASAGAPMEIATETPLGEE